MTRHVHNFNPGPAALPRPVLEQVQRDLLDFEDTGISILETSHRSKVYEDVHENAQHDLRRLLQCSDAYEILFMSGGAQTQFALAPMNLLSKGAFAQYVSTGAWSVAALEEARKLGDARELWSSAKSNFDHVPVEGELKLDTAAAYLHYTSNNTVVGTQYADIPTTEPVTLVCDMSSDILSRPINVSRFGLIYAGAQKNMGPAGVTVVIIRRDVAERCRANLPSTLSYAAMAAKNSLLNTPPVFAIYVLGLVTKHLIRLGGLSAIAAENAAKAQLLYDTIDASDGFYRGCAQPDSRSHMNVTFRLANPALEKRFLSRCLEAGMIGLEGHRSVGGIRASLYNAVPKASVQGLAEFMQEFQNCYG